MSSNQPDQPAAPIPLPEPRVHGSDQSPLEKNPQINPKLAQHAASTSEASPVLNSRLPFQYYASLHPIDTTSAQANPTIASPHVATPLSAGLRLQTDHLAEKSRRSREEVRDEVPIMETPAQPTVFNAGLPVRSSSIRSVYSSRPHRTGSLSPGSAISSPGVGPLVDMTPLPSPISLWGSPKLWKSDHDQDDSACADIRGEPSEHSPQITSFTRIPSKKKRKIPHIARGATGQETSMHNSNAAGSAQQRSFSDYAADGVQLPKLRNIAVSVSGDPQQPSPPSDDQMHREEYLGVQRGLIAPKPPTPPDSNRGLDSGDQESPSASPRPAEKGLAIMYEARTLRLGQIKRWKALGELGKGSFSTVMLATSESLDKNALGDAPSDEARVDAKSLVAVKICEHGPAGGADEQKVQNSIKREVELMKSINHPSLVHLKAVNMLDRQTIMVENYCAGGDLYDLASTRHEALTPSLIRRIFAELVAAVRYLHLQYIVHRDIKLENVLVNVPTATLIAVSDWPKHPLPVVTLTDLGLGRWIPRPPESPMLTTACGSEDYAAPEVLLGDPYDGRLTDSWALGVLLYALMEGRLPFDPVPHIRSKAPKNHRIARSLWMWVKYADDDDEWDSFKGKELEGADKIVTGLLIKARKRWTLDKVQETEWVKGGIEIEEGVRRQEDGDEED